MIAGPGYQAPPHRKPKRSPAAATAADQEDMVMGGTSRSLIAPEVMREGAAGPVAAHVEGMLNFSWWRGEWHGGCQSQAVCWVGWAVQ